MVLQRYTRTHMIYLQASGVVISLFRVFASAIRIPGLSTGRCLGVWGGLCRPMPRAYKDNRLMCHLYHPYIAWILGGTAGVDKLSDAAVFSRGAWVPPMPWKRDLSPRIN